MHGHKLAAQVPAACSPSASSQEQAVTVVYSPADASHSYDAMWCSAHVCFLLLQEVGASNGLAVLQKEAQTWSTIFRLSPIRDVLPCICSLIRPPVGGPDVAEIFGPQLMAALGRAILSGDALLEEQGLPLLVELCMALRPEGRAAQPSGLPVILTAEQNGVQLAAYINSLVSSWSKPDTSSSSQKAAAISTQSLADGTRKAGQTNGNSVAAAWVAVLCLPHANSNSHQVIKLLQTLIKATTAAVEKSGSPQLGADNTHAEEVLFLQCYARGVLASVLEAHAPQDLTQHLADTLQLLTQHPLNFHMIRCAAEVASVATKSGKKLPLQQLKVRHITSDVGPVCVVDAEHTSKTTTQRTLSSSWAWSCVEGASGLHNTNLLGSCKRWLFMTAVPEKALCCKRNMTPSVLLLMWIQSCSVAGHLACCGVKLVPSLTGSALCRAAPAVLL